MRYERSELSELRDRSLALSPAARALIKRKFGSVVGSFDGYKDSMDVHKDHTQTEFVNTVSDDLGGSLGRYGYFAAPSGVSDGHGNLCISALYCN